MGRRTSERRRPVVQLIELYDRQRRIPGWEQERLSEARVVVLGGGWLAGWCALGLACLGVGRITLMEAPRPTSGDQYWFPLRPGEARVAGWAAWLASLGFPNRIIARASDPLAGDRLLLPAADAVACATGAPGLLPALGRLARDEGVPVVLGTATSRRAAYTLLRTGNAAAVPPGMPAASRGVEGALPAAVIAPLLVEEVRRILLPLPGDAPFPAGQTLLYDPTAPERFQPHPLAHRPPAPPMPTPSPTLSPAHPYTANRRVLIAGAGALGTFAALSLAAAGGCAHCLVVDRDFIEWTNLHRQPLYWGAVGEGKAITLAGRLSALCPNMEVEQRSAPVAEAHLDEWEPDLVLACMDRFAPCADLHDWCRARRIPVVNGGTSAFTGHLEVYRPGETACLDCQLDLSGLARREEDAAAHPSRCAGAPEPSIATTNALIGALMAAEATGEAPSLRGVLHYDAGAPLRFSAGRPTQACACGSEEWKRRGDGVME